MECRSFRIVSISTYAQGTEFRKAIEFRKFVRRVYRDAKKASTVLGRVSVDKVLSEERATRNSGTGENNAFEEACRATIYRERLPLTVYLEAKEDRPRGRRRSRERC